MRMWISLIYHPLRHYIAGERHLMNVATALTKSEESDFFPTQK